MSRPGGRNWLAPAGLACMMALWLLAVMAPPAAAHGGGSSSGSNFRSFFVDPGADCLQWNVYAGDGYIGLHSNCPGTATVLGYEGEPYLEFSIEGVRENRNSPASYLNRDSKANVKVPANASASADPDWVAVSALSSYRWHDHRTHWMSNVPPQTSASSTRVTTWTIPVQFDDLGDGSFGYVIEASGELWYDAPLPWWIPITLAGVPIALLLFVVGRRALSPPDARRAPWPALARPVAAALAAVTVLTVMVAIDDLFVAGQTNGARAAAAGIAAVVALAAGWSAWRARAGDDTAFLALVGAAVALGWAYGWVDRGLLSASQLNGRLPDLLVRLTVGLELLIVLPCVVAMALWQWHVHRNEPPPTAASVRLSDTAAPR